MAGLQDKAITFGVIGGAAFVGWLMFGDKIKDQLGEWGIWGEDPTPDDGTGARYLPAGQGAYRSQFSYPENHHLWAN